MTVSLSLVAGWIEKLLKSRWGPHPVLVPDLVAPFGAGSELAMWSILDVGEACSITSGANRGGDPTKSWCQALCQRYLVPPPKAVPHPVPDLWSQPQNMVPDLVPGCLSLGASAIGLRDLRNHWWLELTMLPAVFSGVDCAESFTCSQADEPVRVVQVWCCQFIQWSTLSTFGFGSRRSDRERESKLSLFSRDKCLNPPRRSLDKRDRPLHYWGVYL